MLRRITVALVAGLASSTACEDARTRDAVTTSDSAGVVIVRNTQPARDTIRLTAPDLRIGHDESKPASIFREVHDVAFTRSGGLVVVDGGSRVVVFDSLGGSPRTLGAKGRGPGEYLGVRWALLRGDTIALWDVVQRRMLFFRESGEVLGSLAMPDNREGRRIVPVADGWLDEAESGQYTDTMPARGVIVRRGADGLIRDTVVGPYPIPEIGWKIDDPRTGSGSMVNPPALGIAPAWTADRERLVWASAIEPRIHIWRPNGQLARIIELPYAAMPPTAQQRDTFIATLAERYGMPPEVAARSRASTIFTDTIPVITSVVLDDRGDIWAASFDAAQPFDYVGASWDVLADDGRIARRVEFPSGFTLRQVRGDRALGTRTLESGVSTVEVYRLR